MMKILEYYYVLYDICQNDHGTIIQNLEYELTLSLVPLHLQLNQCGGLAESKKDYDHDILVCTKPRS